jgi:hypothetical protein
MTAANHNNRLARAYVDGRLFDSNGWGGVRVAVRVAHDRPVARLLEARAADPQHARLMGIEEALLLARELGARQVVVFCDDESAVRQVRGEEEPPGPALRTYLRVAALMNQFRRATVLQASTVPPSGPCAMPGFNGAEVRVLGQPRNLSLFPALG